VDIESPGQQLAGALWENQDKGWLLGQVELKKKY
jgi:hypothetical protein